MTGKVPRMADRKPNLEGVWAYGTVTPIERPAQFAGKRFMNDTEAEQVLRQSVANRRAQQAAQLGVPEFVEPDRPFVTIDGRKPTSIIFDPPNGQIPYIAPNVPQWPIPNRFDGPEDIPLSEKCQRALEVVPIFPSTGLLYMQIVQSHDYVAFVHESLHTARIVPLDGRPHISEEIRTWYGDKRGRWEGDTFVVESTNFRDQLNQRGRRSRFDRNLRVVGMNSRSKIQSSLAHPGAGHSPCGRPMNGFSKTRVTRVTTRPATSSAAPAFRRVRQRRNRSALASVPPFRSSQT
jgi:hypothetical protein